MKNSNEIDPSIAFCTKSASANCSNFFNEKEVIFRKLINPYSEQLQKDCYIAIDKSQSAELGELTLIDYNTDLERLGDKVMNQSSLGKVIAYSSPNDAREFNPICETMGESATQNGPSNNQTAYLTTITPNDLTRFRDALNEILESGLFSNTVYTDLSQLHSSLETFKILLTDSNTPKTAQIIKLVKNAKDQGAI